MWYDERDGRGVIEDSKGNEYYFDSSVLSEGFKPKRGAEVSFSSEKVGGVLAAQKVSGSKNESKPLDLRKPKTKDFLRIANEMEDRGDGFFDRHGKDATLWVRVKGDSQADNTQWPRANAIVEELSQAGIWANGPEIDRMSGHLRITVKNIYSSDN